jgi:hypothetical protein
VDILSMLELVLFNHPPSHYDLYNRVFPSFPGLHSKPHT